MARADLPGADTTREEPRTVILETNAGGIDRDLEATLRELVGRLHLRLVREGASQGGRVVARVRIESSERGALLTVEGSRGDVGSVRREIERGDSQALFRETLAHVILGAIEPLAAVEEKPEQPPAPPAEPDVAPRRNERSNDPLRVSIGARAGPNLLATDRTGVAFAGVLAVTGPSALRPRAELHAGYVLPSRMSRNSVGGEFRLAPFRLGAGIEPLTWPSMAIEVTLLGGVDVVSFSPTAAPPSVHLGESSTRVQPTAGASAGARFRLSRNAELVLTTGVDVDAAPRRWVIASDAGRESLFETARLRPYASLGLDWAMAGAAPAPKAEGSP